MAEPTIELVATWKDLTDEGIARLRQKLAQLEQAEGKAASELAPLTGGMHELERSSFATARASDELEGEMAQGSQASRQWAESMHELAEAEQKVAAGSTEIAKPARRKALGEAFDFSKITAGAKEAGRELGGVFSALGGSGAANIVGRVALLGGAAAVIAGFASVLAHASKEATELERALTGAFTVIDERTISIEALRGEVLNLADDTGVAAKEIAEASSVLLQESTERNEAEVQALLESSVKLSRVGLLPVAESAKLLTDILDGYGKKAGESGRITALLFKGAKDAGVPVRDLGGAVSRLGILAGQLNVPLEEVIALIGQLRDRGVPAQSALFGVSSMLLKISGAVPGALDAIRAQGVELDVAALKGKGLIAVLQEVERASRGNEQARVQLFGSGRTASAIAEALRSSEGELQQRIQGLRSAESELDATLLRIQNRVDEKVKRASEKVDRFTTEIGIQLRAGLAAILPDSVPAPGANREFEQALIDYVGGSVARADLGKAIFGAQQLEKIRAEAQAAGSDAAGEFLRLFQENAQQFRSVGGAGGLSVPSQNLLDSLGTALEQALSSSGGLLGEDLRGPFIERLRKTFRLSEEEAEGVAENVGRTLKDAFGGEVVKTAADLERRAPEITRALLAGLARALPQLGADLQASGLQALNKAAEAANVERLFPDAARLARFESDGAGKFREVWEAVLVDPLKEGAGKAQKAAEEVLERLRKTAQAGAESFVGPREEGQAFLVPPKLQEAQQTLESFVSSPAARQITEPPEQVKEAMEALRAYADEAQKLHETLRRVQDDRLEGTEKEVRSRELAIEGLREQLAAVDAATPGYFALTDQIARLNEELEQFKVRSKGAREAQLQQQAEQLNSLLSLEGQGDDPAEDRRIFEARKKAEAELREAVGQLGGAALDELARARERINDLAGKAAQRLVAFAAVDPLTALNLPARLAAIARAASAAQVKVEADFADKRKDQLRSALQDTAELQTRLLPQVAQGYAQVTLQVSAQEAALEGLRRKLGQLAPEEQQAIAKLEGLLGALGGRQKQEFVLDLALKPRLELDELRASAELAREAQPILQQAQAELDALLEKPASSEEFLDVLDRARTKLLALEAAAQRSDAAFGRGVRAGFEAKIREFGNAAQNGFELAAGAMDSFVNQGNDALADFVLGAKKGTDAFKAFARGVAADLARLASQGLFRMLASSLFGGLFPSGGDLGGGEVLHATGGVFPGRVLGTTGTVGSYAAGGVAVGRQTAIIGDNSSGYEAFVPLPGPGRGIPVEFQGPAPAAGASVTVYYQVQQIDTKSGEQFLDGHARRLSEIIAHRMGGQSRALTQSTRRAARS